MFWAYVLLITAGVIWSYVVGLGHY